MDYGDWLYLAFAINPVGGLLVAIPWGVFDRDYPWPLLLASGPLLAYVQVVIVDVAFDGLNRLKFWRALLTKRSVRTDRLLQSGGAFWPVFLLTPFLGPWSIMALMRYAGVPQRRIATPILSSLAALTAVLIVACRMVPTWFGH